jgi:hypothetical protein
MAWEIGQEVFRGGLEATPGTAVTALRELGVESGSIVPFRTRWKPGVANGIIAGVQASVETQTGSTWEAEGPADCGSLPFWMNLAVQAVAAPATATANGGRLWTFDMAGITQKSATLYWSAGDAVFLRSAYNLLDTLTITNDASSEDGATLSASGFGKYPANSPGGVHTSSGSTGQYLPGQRMQLWMDSGTGATIGTTEITGRVLGAEHEITTGLRAKYIAGGAASDLSFTKAGFGRQSATTRVTFELEDFTQYNLFEAGTYQKVRVRHNGALMGTSGGAEYYYLQVDIEGYLEDLEWGDNADGANRTVSFSVDAHYSTTDARALRVLVNNQSATT